MQSKKQKLKCNLKTKYATNSKNMHTNNKHMRQKYAQTTNNQK